VRVVAEIPHPRIRITVFAWNAKYIMKLEAGPYEQVFKIAETDISGIGQVKEILSNEFIDQCIQRFNQMHIDFSEQCNKTIGTI
jgi:hypothetical protein